MRYQPAPRSRARVLLWPARAIALVMAFLAWSLIPTSARADDSPSTIDMDIVDAHVETHKKPSVTDFGSYERVVILPHEKQEAIKALLDPPGLGHRVEGSWFLTDLYLGSDFFLAKLSDPKRPEVGLYVFFYPKGYAVTAQRTTTLYDVTYVGVGTQPSEESALVDALLVTSATAEESVFDFVDHAKHKAGPPKAPVAAEVQLAPFSPLPVLLAFGLLVVLALVGLVRAIRAKTIDGSRLLSFGAVFLLALGVRLVASDLGPLEGAALAQAVGSSSDALGAGALSVSTSPLARALLGPFEGLASTYTLLGILSLLASSLAPAVLVLGGRALHRNRAGLVFAGITLALSYLAAGTAMADLDGHYVALVTALVLVGASRAAEGGLLWGLSLLPLSMVGVYASAWGAVIPLAGIVAMVVIPSGPRPAGPRAKWIGLAALAIGTIVGLVLTPLPPALGDQVSVISLVLRPLKLLLPPPLDPWIIEGTMGWGLYLLAIGGIIRSLDQPSRGVIPVFVALYCLTFTVEQVGGHPHTVALAVPMALLAPHAATFVVGLVPRLRPWIYVGLAAVLALELVVAITGAPLKTPASAQHAMLLDLDASCETTPCTVMLAAPSGSDGAPLSAATLEIEASLPPDSGITVVSAAKPGHTKGARRYLLGGTLCLAFDLKADACVEPLVPQGSVEVARDEGVLLLEVPLTDGATAPTSGKGSPPAP